MSPKELSDIRRKQKVFAYAKEIKNVSKACRYYGISRETYYQWKRAFEIHGEKGLINSGFPRKSGSPAGLVLVKLRREPAVVVSQSWPGRTSDA